MARAQSEVARAQDDVDRRAPLVATGAVGQGGVRPRAECARGGPERAGGGPVRHAGGARATRLEPVADRGHLGRAASERAACGGARARGLPRPGARRAEGSGRRLRRQAQRAARPARAGRGAADVAGRAEAGLGRCQLQGRAAAQPAHRPAGGARRRRLRQEGRLPRHGRGPGRGHRLGVRAAAGAERDRQLDQGRAARAGAHRPRPAGSRPASVAGRPVDGREGRRQPDRRADARRCVALAGGEPHRGLRSGEPRGRGRRPPRHRRQPRPCAEAGRRADARRGAGGGGAACRSPARRRSRRRAHRCWRACTERRRLPVRGSFFQRVPPCRPRPCATSRERRPSQRPARRGAPAGVRAPARRPARARHGRAVAGDLHERARHVDRQRVDPRDRRRHGGEPGAGHLGDHLVRGRQRDLGAVDRLAHAALRPGAPLHREHPAVRHRLVAVRAGAQHRHADRVPRAAGAGRGADDPAVADAAAGELSGGHGGHRDGDVGDDGAGRTGGRAAARRLDHRQHLLALDLLHQHPGRHPRGGADLVDLSQARSRAAPRAARLRRPRACWCCGSARCRS